MEDDTSSAPEWSIDYDSEHELYSLYQYVAYIGILSLKRPKTDKSSDAYQHWVVVTCCDYHRLRSAHCCNDIQQSQWENGNFAPPPVDQKPVKILFQKMHILITSWGATCTPYSMGIGRRLSTPQVAKI